MEKFFYPSTFKWFSPLNRLNSSLFNSGVFKKSPANNLDWHSSRYKRFSACKESFNRNFDELRLILIRIADHYSIDYTSKPRLNPKPNAKNHLLLNIDVESFFVKVKILLDDIAFFIPFYYKDPILNSKGLDIRDLDHPLDFRTLKSIFTEKHPTLDPEFSEILRLYEKSSEDICDIRKFLLHRFHELMISPDHWTQTQYAFLYDFNNRKDFIPDIFLYVSEAYYELVRFLKKTEEHFKVRCAASLPSFNYFYEGFSYSRHTNKAHLFFAGLGRLINQKILIRIHEGRRNDIESLLEKFMREYQLVCKKCDKVKICIKPTMEQYVLINASCSCGKITPIPSIIKKRFFPYFMDKNHWQDLWGLIPYNLER